VIAAFREWFNKAPPRRATLLDWEKRASEVRIFWVYGDFSATLYSMFPVYIIRDLCEL